MNQHRIMEGVREVMRQHLQITVELKPETHLLRDLQLDSLKQLTLVVELENHFRICFEDGDEGRLETIGDLVSLIASRVQGIRTQRAGPHA
ncbi:MAG: acyl carrier protein [Acidobacteriota bacterium]